MFYFQGNLFQLTHKILDKSILPFKIIPFTLFIKHPINQMSFEQQSITLSNGQSINYVQINPQGQQTIIFVHGNVSAWVWWADVLEVFKHNSKYHLIAIDQRGFGKSSYNQPVTRFGQHAEDLVNFIIQKSLKNVVLIGWSYGGGICLKTAQIAPQLVYKIIPTCSVGYMGLDFINQNGQKATTRQQILAIPKFTFAQNVRQTRNYQTQKSIFDAVLFTHVPNYPQQKKNQMMECSFIQKGYFDVMVALANPDIKIEKIKTKTLMIHGNEDVVVKLQTVIETGKVLNNCLEIWEKHGHMIPIQDTKRYVERITKFIDEQ